MSRRVTWLAGASVVIIFVVTGCSMFGRSSDRQDRFVRPGAPRVSPSGSYTASLESGPEQNGVATLIVVITKSDGAEVFRDDDAYSTRHGVGVTWLSERDQLWILSADVGTSYVEQRDGAWTKTVITPENRGSVPAEIEKLQ